MAHFTIRDLPTPRISSKGFSKSPVLPPAGRDQWDMQACGGLLQFPHKPLFLFSFLSLSFAIPVDHSLGAIWGAWGFRDGAALGEHPS